MHRLMVDRCNNTLEENPIQKNRPVVSNYGPKSRKHPLPYLSLLDHFNEFQPQDILNAVYQMIYTANKNGLPNEFGAGMEKMFLKFSDIFRISL